MIEYIYSFVFIACVKCPIVTHYGSIQFWNSEEAIRSILCLELDDIFVLKAHLSHHPKSASTQKNGFHVIELCMYETHNVTKDKKKKIKRDAPFSFIFLSFLCVDVVLVAGAVFCSLAASVISGCCCQKYKRLVEHEQSAFNPIVYGIRGTFFFFLRNVCDFWTIAPQRK